MFQPTVHYQLRRNRYVGNPTGEGRSDIQRRRDGGGNGGTRGVREVGEGEEDAKQGRQAGRPGSEGEQVGWCARGNASVT